MEENLDLISIINAHLDKCIANFAKQIKFGIGWIVKEDVMRQFTQSYEEFNSILFDRDQLETIICSRLAAYVNVYSEEEAYEKGLLD